MRMKSAESPTAAIVAPVTTCVDELLLCTVTIRGLSATKTPSGAKTTVVGLPGGGGVKEIGGGAAPSVTTTFVPAMLPVEFFTVIAKVYVTEFPALLAGKVTGCIT
jgi:hypothetical protein